MSTQEAKTTGKDEKDGGKVFNGFFERFGKIRKSGSKEKTPNRVRPERLKEVGG